MSSPSNAPVQARSRRRPGPAATSAVVPVRGQRLDIQALRAIAVGLVVVYHFWPARLTGGYVGVDVFFVISGFLITTHLIERPPTGWGDLVAFWGRRVRRLLPAALLVLAVTLFFTWLVAPVTTFGTTARQAVASAFYVQNWALAGEAVDYLAADNAATPVQHYWSLSIEEQFYLAWPVLVLAAYVGGRALGRSVRAAVGLAVVVVVAISLVWSIRTSGSDPAAYFESWTRFWELGVGALAAVVAPRLARVVEGRRAARNLVAWLGIGAVVVTAYSFDGSTVFPGAAALVPVLGTAVVILADPTRGPLSPLPLAGLWPVQMLGKISYSVYLWHWPVVVLLPFVLTGGVSWPVKLVALAGVVLLSTLTQRWVEERFRARLQAGAVLRRSFGFAVVGMLVVTGGAVALDRSAGDGRIDVPEVRACFGAAAAVDPACSDYGDDLYTDPLFALDDKPAVYGDDCMSSGSFERHVSCTYGPSGGRGLRVALVGNSHAGQYLPILQRIAAQRGWRIETYLAYECHTIDRVIEFPEADRTAGCRAWNDWAIDQVAEGGFDLVVTSNRTQRPIEGLDGAENAVETRRAYARVLRRWTDSGARVLVARDNPRRVDETTAPDCVAQSPQDLAACDTPLDEATVGDPQYDAARRLSASGNASIATFDPTPYLCPEGRCRSVIGGVIALWDTNHMTATFARTLTPAVRRALRPLLPPG